MNEEIDREITTKKVTSNPNTPLNPNTSVEGYNVSEQRTTKVRNNNDNAVGLILIILVPLALGAAIAAYFFYNRTPQTQIITPVSAPIDNTVKDNKSTVIERNNTVIREVAPATSQPTPTVQINVPPAAPQPAPRVQINVPPAAAPAPAPTVTVQAQPSVILVPTPAATTGQPQNTATPTPIPTTRPNN